MSNLIRSRKSRVSAILATAAVSMGLVAAPAAQAQVGPIVTGGLVNVTIVDAVDLRNVNVQIPIGVAANVCGVNVAVLAAQDQEQGPIDCTAATTQDLPVRFQPGNGVN